MSDIRYEFIMSQIKHIRDIKENEKTKISLVYYEGCQGPCILKICKDRDLSEVYQALMETKHPNVAQVYDCIYEDGNTYVIEEYINGKTVADVLATKGTFSEDETNEIMTELCDGLEVLHSHEPPIIHNDIKASNIMITEDGKAKLFDFDISRTYKEESYKNTKLMGTHEYAAPEHYGFGQSDPRTDIYSLGVTMHEMLTGVGLNQEHNVTYQGGLAKIIQKCVEIDRKKRYASAALLKSDLEKRKKNGCIWVIIIACICVALLLLMGGMFLIKHFGGNESTGKNTETTDNTWKDNSETEGEKNTEGNSETEGNIGTEGSSEIGENIGSEGGSGTDGNTESEGGSETGENTGNEGGSDTGGNTGGEGGSGTGGNTGSEGGSGSGENTGSEDGSDAGDNSGIQDDPSEDNKDTDTSTEDAHTVYKFQGTAESIATWSDGTGAMVEQESGKFYLRSTDGKETSLEGLTAPKGWSLHCHPYTNQMYLFLFDNTKHSVYSVNRELKIELIKTLGFSAENEWFLFQSDGSIVYFHKGIILDGKNLTQVGTQSWFVNGVPYLIHDNLYSIQPGDGEGTDSILEWNKDSLDPYLQGGFYNELVNEYPMNNLSLGVDVYEYAYAEIIYTKSDGIYFVATMNGEKALVRFNGQKYEAVTYLKDYEGSENYGSYYSLYVTDTAFGFYDEEKNTIVEFTLE